MLQHILDTRKKYSSYPSLIQMFSEDQKSRFYPVDTIMMLKKSLISKVISVPARPILRLRNVAFQSVIAEHSKKHEVCPSIQIWT